MGTKGRGERDVGRRGVARPARELRDGDQGAWEKREVGKREVGKKRDAGEKDAGKRDAGKRDREKRDAGKREKKK